MVNKIGQGKIKTINELLKGNPSTPIHDFESNLNHYKNIKGLFILFYFIYLLSA